MSGARAAWAAALLLHSAAGTAFGASEGGWVSSGGELFQLTKNPWFVLGKKGGVKEARYCVEIDASAMSASETTIRDSVRKALKYWKDEFSQNGQSVPGRPGFAVLATQEFILQDSCDEKTTDLRFVFGHGKLRANEAKWLVDPRKYVGVTVRQAYDAVRMKGQGFIYLSGDRGEFPYQNPGDLIERAWEHPRLLELALIHEVGHVMGVPHTGTGLMSEVFPQQLLHERFSQFYLQNPIPSFLNPPMTFEICRFNGVFNPEFFRIAGRADCLVVTGGYEPNGDYRWELSSREKEGAPLKPVGTVRAQLALASFTGARPSVVINLMPDQEVFAFDEKKLNHFMLGPVYQEGTAKGAFRLPGSLEPHELQIELRTDSLSMVGMVGGRPLPVLVYSPPSLLKMLFPINGP